MPFRSDEEPCLPLQLTPFIGREQEISDTRRLLAGNRLVTITGAGGSGKTRLALEVAQRVEREGDLAVRWVELAPLERGDLMAQHVAAQLLVREQTDRQGIDVIVDALRPGPLLLVLDNCEHLVDAAASFVDLLLRRCPQLTVLATSREALGVAGERAWLIPGLRLGGADAADDEAGEAERLFIDRARSVDAGFRLTPSRARAVRQICSRLDGLPLAIELAASRVSVLTPEQIADRLGDAFRLLTTRSRTVLERHRALRATVEWSVRLLSAAEQELLRRLSVFAGTFSLEAVESVCAGDGLEARDLIDTLSGLVARSLVTMQERAGFARYALLEIIRQYAREQLAKDAELQRQVSRRHALFNADLAERALPALERHHSAEWADLPSEHDNLRAAMQWAFHEGEDRIGHRLVGALWWYWGQSGQWSEAFVWLEEAMRRPDPGRSREWGQVLNGAGTFAYLEGDLARGRSQLEEAVRVLGEAGDHLHEVMALSTLVNLMCSAGEAEAALDRGRAAAGLARTLDESWPLAHTMSNALGLAHALLGEHDLAEACFREGLDAASRAGHRWGIAEAARALAAVAVERGEPAEAAAHLRTAIASSQAIRDPFQSVRILFHSEPVLAGLGKHDAVARVAGAIAGLRQAGILILPSDLSIHEPAVHAARAALGGEAFAGESSLAFGWTFEQALAFADRELESRPGGIVTRAVSEGDDPGPSADVRPVAAPIHATSREAADLRVRALGGIEILVDERPVPPEVWSHAKPRELLVYLLCHPEGRTREQVGLAFWPEASAVQVKNSFHVLLHKLRKNLGRKEFVVTAAERYRINPELDVWFDAAAFEVELSAALREPDAATRARRLEAALGLYRGDFMDGEVVGDWHVAVHDRLRRRFCDGLSTLADLQIAHDALEDAIGTLERLIVRDDLREDAYRRLMICLARTGRRDQALRHYRRLVMLLRDELDAEPEPATEELAGRLLESATV